MSNTPPPFANHRPVSDSETWDKILSGDITALVYSSKARGDFGPVAISAAEFFLADQAGQTADDGEPDPELKPYQIMVCDRDRRRPSAVRHRIPIPHWVYVMKAASAASNTDKIAAPATPRKRHTSPQQMRAEAALKTLFGDEIPSREQVDDRELLNRVNAHIGKSARPIERDSLLRAAGRRRK
jgi:hypothetical protein